MDPTTLILLGLFVVLIIFMFRSNKKRQKAALELQQSVAVGAEVMTNSGIYGTVTEIDDSQNLIWIESTPGTVLKLHRQVVAKVVTPVDQPDATLTTGPESDDSTASAPEATPEDAQSASATPSDPTAASNASDAPTQAAGDEEPPEFGERIDPKNDKS